MLPKPLFLGRTNLNLRKLMPPMQLPLPSHRQIPKTSLIQLITLILHNSPQHRQTAILIQLVFWSISQICIILFVSLGDYVLFLEDLL